MFMIIKSAKKYLCILCSFLILVVSFPCKSYAYSENQGSYYVGTGIYDITGPAAEVVMTGYANTKQTTKGIHLRLRSRAFIIQDQTNDKRIVFVSADLCQLFQGVKQGVIRKLNETYGDLYNDSNVLLSATHTHSGPGGYSHYELYNVTSYGYIEQNYDCIVDGIYNSIARAHNNLEPGYIEINTGKLKGTSINRSIEAYENNPLEEKEMYTDDVDRDMVVLNFKNEDGDLLGIINWFPLHPTSMGNNNQLISSDNKGYASYIYEKEMGTNYSKNKTFVAAFAQSNCGDASPNIYGGEAGYGDNDFESTEYAGQQQYLKCKELSESAHIRLTGNIDYIHTYKDFADISIESQYIEYRANSTTSAAIKLSSDEVSVTTSTAVSCLGNEIKKTFPAAIGYSFACGAEDGPSNVDLFYEGMTADEYTIDGDPDLVKVVQRLIGIAPGFSKIIGVKYPELWKVHYPKPILFATSQGEPYPWTPEVMPLQIIKIGPLNIAAVPAEFTSMSGRRLKKIIKQTMDEASLEDNIVVIAGLSNAYSGYVATPEEYDIQHYEGASTHFGKWTLPAYIQEFHKLANAMVTGSTIDPGPIPRDIKDKQRTYQTGVVLDNVPISKQFGQVEQDVKSQYSRGETVSVSFWSGHPKNNLRIQSSYLEIQKQQGDEWKTIANDWDWETKYSWDRIDGLWGSSLSIIEWDIPQDAESGTYRIVHYGSYKNGWNGKIIEYNGISSSFSVK